MFLHFLWTKIHLRDRSYLWATLTTWLWGRSKTLTPLMVSKMSPTVSPELSAGVPGSMAETTTGLEPCIRNPNSPSSLCTVTVLLHSRKNGILACSWKLLRVFLTVGESFYRVSPKKTLLSKIVTLILKKRFLGHLVYTLDWFIHSLSKKFICKCS